MSVVVERVIELFDSTCIKQFESMCCDIRSLECLSFKHGDGVISALIECHSEDVRLSLTISASSVFLVNTMPMIGDRQLDTVSFQEDWCLELANRFLGRLKNKLLSHDCSLNMGLPVLLGDSPNSGGLKGAGSFVERAFQLNDTEENGLIKCSLSILLLNDKMTLDDYEDEDEDWFDESELLHL